MSVTKKPERERRQARLEVGLDTLLAGLRAAGEETRLRILALLGEGDLAVKELTDILGQSQPRVSRHLKLMVEAGLVRRFKEGSWAFFRIAEAGPGAAMARAILALADADDPVLARDRARLDETRRRRAEAATAYFRVHAREWDALRSLYVDESEVEAAMLQALGPQPIRSLLDLGTGTGRILQLFAPRISRVLGLDVSHDMLNVARAALDSPPFRHIQVRHGDIYDPPADPGGYDAIVVHQVLHYLADPARAVREASRTLAPGGRLLIVDFAPHDLEFLRDEHAHRRLGFGSEEVRRWIEAAGLRPRPALHLKPAEGGKLTVTLWVGVRESVEQQDRMQEVAA